MKPGGVLNVETFLNERKLSAYQVAAAVLCLMVLVIDGFDTTMPAFVAPALKHDWNLTPTQIGPIFGSGLAGLMIGSFIMGPLADRFGRKAIVLASVAAFGLFSFASASADSFAMLLCLRFLAGLGLGGATPNCYTLVAELFPISKRSAVVSMLTAGTPIGGALAGLVAAKIIPEFGWRAMFVVGGVLPLLVLIPMAVYLPDSIRYLALYRKGHAKLARILHRIAPDQTFNDVTFVVDEKQLKGSPVAELFRDGLASGTVTLWLSMFTGLMAAWFIVYWLPLLASTSGTTVRLASLFTAALLAGTAVGSVLNGLLMARVNPASCTAIFCLLTFALLVAFGQIPQFPWLMMGVVCAIGFSLGSLVGGVNGLASMFYPTANRATGASWTMGVGKLGSVCGSLVGGYMMAGGWSAGTQFAAFAVPLLLPAICLFFMRGHGWRGTEKPGSIVHNQTAPAAAK